MLARSAISATATLFLIALGWATPAAFAQPARAPSRFDAFPAVSVTAADQAQGCTHTPLQMDMAEIGPLVEERFRKAGNPVPPPAQLGNAVAFNLGGWAGRYLGERARRLSRTEGPCQDWHYIVSKWQQTVGTPLTGTVSAEDARKLFAYADAGDAPVLAHQQAQVQQRDRDQAAAAAESARDAAKRGKAPSIFGIPFGHSLDLPKCGARPAAGQFEFGKGCSPDVRVRSEALLDRRIQEQEREVQQQVRSGRKL